MTYEKNGQDSQVGMGYQHTLMYGRYTKDLGDYAKSEAVKMRKDLARKRKKEDEERKKELNKYRGKYTSKLISVFGWGWRHSFAKLGEDWVFLALLGLIMACIGFVVDIGVGFCYRTHIWLFRHLFQHAGLQFAVWVTVPVLLILFASTFVHIAPQSIGSGIPEMKTILRGINLKEYLTFRTLVAKVVGLTATLGSGMPLGKEGPLVHIASIVANLLSQLVTSFQGIYANESRKSEMLAAACAVGVATCFGAPIGGVLFSIEVTAVYFAVRNYWRGFFAAVFGATCYRLCAVWFSDEDTVTAVFRTHFQKDFPYDVQELFVFALLGVVCGVGGAFFVWVHRQYVYFIRNSKVVKQFLSTNKFLYPVLVSFVISALTFPKGVGQYVAGELNTFGQVTAFFSNFTWTRTNLTVREAQILHHWVTPDTGVFVSLSGFIIFNFIFAIVASTLPVPSGSFIPVFKIGAAIGRVAGELMHLWFPFGVSSDQLQVIPGGYAMVGAAAFSGAVTRTVSVAVIITEMTGQITHIVPIMIGVLIANGTARYLQPSLYDSIIVIKKLPYLPDLLSSSAGMYSVYVDSFMVREVKCIWKNMTYKELNHVLKINKALQSIPLVDNVDSMILLGSVQRRELLRLIEGHIGRKRRQQIATKWQLEARERAREELDRQLDEVQKRRQSRFEVIPAPDILKLRHLYNDQVLTPQFQPQLSPKTVSGPKKSILKKSNSFLSKSFNSLVQADEGPYLTVTGAENRSVPHQTDPEFSPKADKRDKYGSRFLEMLAISPNSSMRSLKKVILPRERVIDMSSEDQKQWEEEEMAKNVDFDKCHIDPAPFQLVEKTSLLKVHSLFSMVGVNHAYVTAIGRLIGVVALKELRKAIEDSNAGVLPDHPTRKASSASMRAEDPLLSSEDVNITIDSLDSILDDNVLTVSRADNETKD